MVICKLISISIMILSIYLFDWSGVVRRQKLFDIFTKRESFIQIYNQKTFSKKFFTLRPSHSKWTRSLTTQYVILEDQQLSAVISTAGIFLARDFYPTNLVWSHGCRHDWTLALQVFWAIQISGRKIELQTTGRCSLCVSGISPVDHVPGGPVIEGCWAERYGDVEALIRDQVLTFSGIGELQSCHDLAWVKFRNFLT